MKDMIVEPADVDEVGFDDTDMFLEVVVDAVESVLSLS